MLFLEIGQIVVAVFGVVVGVALTLASTRILSDVRRAGIQNGRRTLAEMWVMSDLLTLVVQVVFLLIAGVSVWAQAHHTAASSSWFTNGTWPIPFLRMFGNAALTIKQVLTWRARQQVDAL